MSSMNWENRLNQVDISGPLIPSRFFEESFSIHPHEPLPVPTSPAANVPRIIESSSFERKSENIHVLDLENISGRYSVLNSNSNPLQEENKQPAKTEVISAITQSKTRDFSEDEYVQKISKLSQTILGKNVACWAKSCGPDIEIISLERSSRNSFTLKTCFEVNGIMITRITVSHDSDESKNDWFVILTYVKHSRDYFTGNRYHLQYFDKDLQTTIRKSYTGLRALKRCMFCMSIWNSEMSDVCPLCLFSDYFTRENEVHECPVCKENVKDWTILDCNHRLCYKCLAQIKQPRRCPLCRHAIDG